MEYIKINGWPPDVAREAYAKGNYIESIQILHAWAEHQARELFHLIGATHFKSSIKDTWDIVNTFSLHDSLKILFVLNQLSKEEYGKFMKLNKLRNNIIHSLYKEPYDGERKKVSKKDFDKIFNDSLEQIELIGFKSDELV